MRSLLLPLVLSGIQMVRMSSGIGAESDTETLWNGQWFTEPLRCCRAPEAEDSRALLTALKSFASRAERDDFSAVTRFLETHPDSAWKPSLLTGLAREYFRQGFYSRAKAAWEEVWNERDKIPPLGQDSVAKAGAQLAELYARLGVMEKIRAILPELEKRARSSADAEHFMAARDGLWTMENRPEIAFRCGPLALDRIRAFANPTNANPVPIFNAKSTTNGLSLAEVAKIANEAGMNFQMAFRSPGAEVILPAVVHWKLGHFAALVTERNGLTLAQDPTFWDDAWLSRRALEEECSGYFLVRAGPLPPGWRSVSETEGSEIFGKGATKTSNPDNTTPFDQQVCKPDAGSPMADWNVHLMLVSQRIFDTPIHYTPPVGPPVSVTLSYIQRQNQRFGSLPDWTHNWASFLQIDPRNPMETIWMFLEGGWLEYRPDFTRTNCFRCSMRNPGELVRVATNRFEWRLLDGSVRTYGQGANYNDTSPTLHGFLLSEVSDPAGNSIQLEYGDYDRLETITDAIGQVTQFKYDLPDPGKPPGTSVPGVLQIVGNADRFTKPSEIIDPFGRSAKLGYGLRIDSLFAPTKGGGSIEFDFYSHDLVSIIDPAGIESQFAYSSDTAGPMRFITELTTPYGTTRFDWRTPFPRNTVLEVTHPNGEKERIEYDESRSGESWYKVPFAEAFSEVPIGMPTYNRFLSFRNTYHWDRNAYATGFLTNDYSKARIYHWMHTFNITACSGILESFKAPLEGRVWFNYPGQLLSIHGASLPTLPGTSDRPSRVGRVLDDGKTQLWQYDRNAADKVTRFVDPAGRTFSFIYSADGIDLLEARQTRAGKNELLFSATYNSQHLPLTLTDASRQTTKLTYNPRGQILTVTNPKNETTSLSYDANGYLIAFDGPLPGAQDRSTFSYDAAGRVHSITDQDGYTLTFDYDKIDRVTRVSFPDGTTHEITYDKLDPVIFRDRLKRETRFSYDSLRQLVAIEDALGRVVRFDWCGCGGLQAIIDPLGRMTRLLRDVQGRVSAKEYADGSQVQFEYERSTSRLKSIRDEQNQVTRFTYGIDGFLTKREYTNAKEFTPPVAFTYDPDYPRLLTMTDGEGVTRYTYHPVLEVPAPGAGQVASVDGPWANDTVTYRYDELGRITNRAIQTAASTRRFDEAGRLIESVNALGSFLFTWDGGSDRMKSLRYPNGQSLDLAYHPVLRDLRLQRITHRLPDNSLLSEFTYDHNAEGRITDWTQSQGGATKSWRASYDAEDRLLSLATVATTAGPNNYSFVYDAANNLTQAQAGTQHRDFVANALNELVSVSSPDSAAVTYRWDAEQRLVGIRSGTHETEFGYDGFDRRTHIVEKEGGAMVSDRRYVWCGAELSEERDAAGGTVRKRFFGFGVRSESADDLPPGAYFYAHDHLGSIREMTDAAGRVRYRAEYSPYGEATKLAGDLVPDFGFGGFFQHRATGLSLALYRAYDPKLGRWLSRDPLSEGAGLNLLAYGGADPLNFIDPLGLQTRAAQLTKNLEGQQQAQEVLDGWNKASKTTSKVLKTVDSLAENGLKKTLQNQLKSQGADAAKEITPGEQKEAERLNEVVQERKNDSIEPFGKIVGSKYKQAADGVLGGPDGTPCGPKTSPKSTRSSPTEPGIIDTISDAISSTIDSIFSSAPEPPPPPEPIKRKPLFGPNDRAKAAGGY